MDINSFSKFSKSIQEFQENKNKGCIKHCRNKIALYNSFVIFVSEFEAFKNSTLGNRTFIHRQLADYIFLHKFNSLTQYQDFLRKCLFSAHSYLKYLESKITKKNIDKYIDSLQMIRIDFEELNESVEVNIINSSTSMRLMSGRRKYKDLLDTWGIARNLFFIEDLNLTSDFHYYDIKPFSVFAIRQTIEQYGKEVIGYTTIVDASGSFSKKHLYSSWEFIKKESLTTTSRIALPFDIDVIQKIEKWSHRFVHAGFYADCYIIWQALDMMRELFKSDNQPKRIHTGQFSRRMFGDVLITNYNSLKSDFTTYLNSGVTDATKNVTVNWINIASVKPYIISI
jgi:hypothetical protein